MNHIKKINGLVNKNKILRKIKQTILSNLINLKMYSFSNRVKLKQFPFGVNVLGLVTAEMGLGQSTRLLLDSLIKTNINICVKDFDYISNISRNNKKYIDRLTNDFQYNINIIHLNPPELKLAHFLLSDKLWKSRYNIGFWLWELEKLPNEWINSIRFLDEIWTPSKFIADTVKNVTNKPVRTIHYPIKPEVDSNMKRSHFNLPEKRFLYITMFDFNSTMERKNPKATTQAYRNVSINRNDVGLVIKINHVNNSVLKALNDMTIGLEHVYIVAKTLSDLETHTLISLCDVLVSLHRAEGFGLTMAEAMYLGIPAVATGWSANTEFMNELNSCLVDYTLIDIESDHTFYKKGNKWADPSVEHASELMLKLVGDSEYYLEKSISGKKYIQSEYNLEKSSKVIKEYLETIGGEHL